MRRLAVAALIGLTACSPAAVDPGETTSAPPPTTASAAPDTSAPAPTESPTSTEPEPEPSQDIPETHEFTVTEHESYDQPWALSFLPGTDGVMAITERVGNLNLRYPEGTVRQVSGVPDVVAAGQGGMGDIIPGPTFEADGTVYLSWVEGDGEATGAVVGTATLDLESASLTNLRKIWTQAPKVVDRGHFSHRLLIHDDHLFITSGDRRQMTPAQEMDNHLGKILRLTLDGQPAEGNPFSGEDSPAAHMFWSVGHRNPLGIAVDADGRIWSTEMGPEGGDELNLIQEGGNYGWPEASNGSHYGGKDIPDHTDGDGFVAPKVFWTPSISPGSLMIYQGDLFPAWKGDAFIGALSGERLIRVDLDGENATEAENWPMDARIRAVAEGPDGAIWLLRDGGGGDLLELRPAN